MNDQVNSMTAFRGHVQAMAFARQGGDELSELLFSIAMTKQAERMGPIKTMLFLETHFSDEEGAAIPIVGSKQGETGNRPYDRYTSEVKTADGTRKVPGSWFTDVVKSTARWATLSQEIEYLDQGQGEGVPPHILSMSTGQRAERKAEIRQLIADMRTGLTKGAMLFHQCEAIRKMNPDKVAIKLPILTQKDKDGNPVQVVTGNLIRLMDPSKELEDEVVTVGSFLQYDADKAALDPDKGSIKSLKATATKAPKKGGPAGKSSVTVPANLEQGKTLLNVLATWCDNTTDEGRKVESAILTAIAKGDAEGKELLISCGKVCLALDSIWTVIQPAYDDAMRQAAATVGQRKAV